MIFYRNIYSFLRHKNDIIEKHRMKRGKNENTEDTLIAGRLLLDSPQAFDSIREDATGKRTIKSQEANGIKKYTIIINTLFAI